MQLLKEMLGMGLSVQVKKEFRNKRGDVFPEGATVACEFRDSSVRVTLGDAAVVMPYQAASKFLTKFKPAPSMKALEKMTYDGVATTPLGSRTEPDGYGVHGEPSWLIVMGLI